MAELGIVASVAQLAGMGLSLSIALYDYADKVSNAPKRMNDLAKDVKLTSSVLESFSELLSEARTRPLIRPGALRTAKDAIAECTGIFEEMDYLIEEGKKSLGRFLAPFKESKLLLLSAKLASLKSTLQLLLQVLQYALTVAMQDPSQSTSSLTGVTSQFRALIDEREEARRQYENLKAEIGSSASAPLEPSDAIQLNAISTPVAGSSIKQQESNSSKTLTVLSATTEQQSGGQAPESSLEASTSIMSPTPNKASTVPGRADQEQPQPISPPSGIVSLQSNNDPPRTIPSAEHLQDAVSSLAECLIACLCCPCYLGSRRRTRPGQAYLEDTSPGILVEDDLCPAPIGASYVPPPRIVDDVSTNLPLTLSTEPHSAYPEHIGGNASDGEFAEAEFFGPDRDYMSPTQHLMPVLQQPHPSGPRPTIPPGLVDRPSNMQSSQSDPIIPTYQSLQLEDVPPSASVSNATPFNGHPAMRMRLSSYSSEPSQMDASGEAHAELSQLEHFGPDAIFEFRGTAPPASRIL